MNLRQFLRLAHLVGGALLGTYLYSPWGTLPAFGFAVKVVIFPALLSVTGVAMWQQGTLQQWLRRPGSQPR